MPYRLLTLGRSGITASDGQPVELPVGKPYAVLTYLALAERPVPRDVLAELLWPDSTPARARHSLRQALLVIRRLLGEVVEGAERLAVSPGTLRADVTELESALEAGDIAAVLDLYRGPFLSDVRVQASAEWEEWVEGRRSVVAERVAEAILDAAQAEPDPERATAWLARAVEVQPYRLSYREALFDRLLAAGRADAAEAVLAEARQAELSEDGTLTAWEERLARFRSLRPSSVAAETLQPEFVGRDRELTALVERWKRSVAGRRQLAVVSGPTGMGKTRLAEELAAIVATERASVARAKAAAAERRLEWSLTAELVRSLHALPGAAGISPASEHVLRSLVPNLASGAAAPPREAPSVAIADALVDLAEAVAYEAPLLVILDDLQWVDPESTALLLRAVRRLHAERVMVVCTFRSDELSAKGLAAVEALVREEDGLALPLQPLTRADVAEMVVRSEVELEPERQAELVDRLHSVSRGHPLFIVELLRSLQEDGLLQRHGHGWALAGSSLADLELPHSVRGVVAKRLEHLTDDARDVGRELALSPRGIGVERLRVRSRLDGARFDAGLRELMARSVVGWDAADRLVFLHDQLREGMARRPATQARRARIAAAVAGLALLGAAGVAAVVGGGGGPAYGGGAVLVRAGDSAFALEPAGRGVEDWVRRAGGVWLPTDSARYGHPLPRRLTDGSLVWLGMVQNPADAPDLALYRQGEPPSVVVGRPGDDLPGDLSPDGRRLAYLTEDLATPGYDLQLRLREMEEDTGRVVAASAALGSAIWAPDGRRFAASLGFERDTLLVLTPRGERVLAREAFAIQVETWCGSSRRLVFNRKASAIAPAERILLDLESGTERLLDSSPARGSISACSPDASTLLAATLSEGRTRWYVLDLESEERTFLPDSLIPPAAIVDWVPDRIPPVPQQLVVEPATLSVERGARASLTARLLLDDGRSVDAPVALRSTDPGVVSVLGDGSLSANREGHARIIAIHDRWLVDTARVEVEPGGGASLLLSDDFRDPESRWTWIGTPTPRPVEVEGRAALELLGDGRYADGLVLGEAVAMGTGGTLELELMHPLTRPERQTVNVCLVQADPPESASERAVWALWTLHRRLCMVYPAYELQKWSPGLVSFGFHRGEVVAAAVPPGADSTGWMHVAIQILPDGTTSLFLDRREVATVTAPPDFLHRSSVRPFIAAGSVGTRTFIRDLALWSEPRFR